MNEKERAAARFKDEHPEYTKRGDTFEGYRPTSFDDKRRKNREKYQKRDIDEYER